MDFCPDSAARPSALEQEASCLVYFSWEDPVWPVLPEPSSVGRDAALGVEGLALSFCHCHPGHHHRPLMKRMRRRMMMMNQRKMKMMRSCLILKSAELDPAEMTKGENNINFLCIKFNE